LHAWDGENPDAKYVARAFLHCAELFRPFQDDEAGAPDWAHWGPSTVDAVAAELRAAFFSAAAERDRGATLFRAGARAVGLAPKQAEHLLDFRSKRRERSK
jgi:hypothetical protein